MFNWIKSFGKAIDEIKSPNEIEVVEIDEMHTYIGSKKNSFGFGLLLIEMGINSSTVKLVHEEQKREKNFGRRLKRK